MSVPLRDLQGTEKGSKGDPRLHGLRWGVFGIVGHDFGSRAQGSEFVFVVICKVGFRV